MRIAKYFKDMTGIIGGAWKRRTFLMLTNLTLFGVVVGFLIGFAASTGAAWGQWGLLYAAIGFMLARALFMARLLEDDEARAFKKGKISGRAEGIKEGESQQVLNQIAKAYGGRK